MTEIATNRAHACLERLPTELLSLIFENCQSISTTQRPISKALHPHLNALHFHSINLTTDRNDQFQDLAKAFEINSDLALYVRSISLEYQETDQSSDDGGDDGMIHDINLAMIMKPIRQILSCTKDLKKLRLKDCGGIFKIILSMPSILNGSLEVMELDRNRLGIESIASLKDSGLKKILIIEEEDYLVPASGDAMNWDGFKSLNELIVKLPLTVFDSTYAQQLSNLFSESKLERVELRLIESFLADEQDSIDFTEFMHSLPTSFVKVLKLSGYMINSSVFQELPHLPLLRRLEVLGNLHVDDDSDEESDEDEVESAKKSSRDCRFYLDIVAQLKSLRFFRFTSATLTYQDLQYFLSLLVTPFEIDFFTARSIGKAGQQYVLSNVVQYGVVDSSMNSRGWYRPNFGAFTPDQLSSILQQAQDVGITLDRNGNILKALEVEELYEKDFRQSERGGEALSNAWDLFLEEEEAREE